MTRLSLGLLLLLVLALAVPTASAATALQAISPSSAFSASSMAASVWRGEYFANPNLSGAAAFTRSDANLNFNWGWGAPDRRLPVDRFSVRWTRTVSFTAGTYRFNAAVDDGVRVLVDGQRIIDQWRITAPITHTADIALAAGTHDLTVDYFENTERAQVRVWWNSIPAPAVPAWRPPAFAGSWEGAYYNNRSLTGDPTFKRTDKLVYFDWGVGGPGGGLGADEYSVRWYRTIELPEGRYRFKMTADDGVRVWFDWAAIIDEWHEGSVQTYAADVDIKAGKHEMLVEYFEAKGDAKIKLEWQQLGVNWIGNLKTCMRATKSWVRVYRLEPNLVWEDLNPAGYGPYTVGGERSLFGLPVSGMFGWDGQPYKVELWIDGKLVRTEGDVLAGQPALLLQPEGNIGTTWPCGANLPS